MSCQSVSPIKPSCTSRSLSQSAQKLTQGCRGFTVHHDSQTALWLFRWSWDLRWIFGSRAELVVWHLADPMESTARQQKLILPVMSQANLDSFRSSTPIHQELDFTFQQDHGWF